MYKLALRGQYAHGGGGGGGGGGGVTEERREAAPVIVQSPDYYKSWNSGAYGRGIPAGIDTNDEFAGRSIKSTSSATEAAGVGGVMDMSGIWLNVFYSEAKLWRKISFPPGVTVGQARDICMLRFNVWHRVMEREMLSAKEDKDTDSVAPSTVSSGNGNTRELYGLYWPAGGQWLESLRLVA
ncbi:hypothetical protein IWW38_005543, partial [Coemansia aciculifera]